MGFTKLCREIRATGPGASGNSRSTGASQAASSASAPRLAQLRTCSPMGCSELVAKAGHRLRAHHFHANRLMVRLCAPGRLMAGIEIYG